MTSLDRRNQRGQADVVYELFAIRYATNQRRTRGENFLPPVDAHDAPMPMDFFVWLAASADRLVLIDAGADEETCRTRGHDFLRCPTEALRALRRRPEDVQAVVVTHLHWDHAGNYEKFPNAHFYLHPSEIAHATGPSMTQPFLRRTYSVDQVCSLVRHLYAGRVHFTSAGDEIVPGISVHHVGGHTPGLQMVSVNTARGTVVLASDAMHYFANRDRAVPFPVVTDVAQYLAAFGVLDALAPSRDHVVAGHDPAVMELYPPAVGDDPLIVRLDVAPAERSHARDPR